MPGTNPINHEEKIEVHPPSGGTWGSFLLNPMFSIRAEHVNHQESYEDVKKKIREPQGDGTTYLQRAQEYFKEIYWPTNGSITKETVEEALSRTYVDDQTYKERFGIGEIEEDNYELAVCHIYYQMTTGAIAASYYRNLENLYSNPMKVTVLNNNPEEEKALFVTIVPEEPHPVEEPARPSVWKRFWNHLGFYKKDMETYRESQAKYNDYVEDKKKYDENVKKAYEEAQTKEKELRNRESPSEKRKNQVYTVMRDQETRAELHAAAKEALQSLPDKGEDRQLLEVKKYIPTYSSDQFKVKSFMIGMGRVGSLATQLLAYTAAVNNLSLEAAVNAPESVKQEAGKQFAELFLEEIKSDKKNDGNKKEAKAPDEKSEEEMKRIRDGQMDKAASALAQMYQYWSKAQLHAVDVLDPKSIRENALHNIRVGEIGMDIGQMLQGKGALRDKVAQKMGGNETLENVKMAFGAARSASGPLGTLCDIYRSDEFLNRQVPETLKRLNDAFTMFFGGERIDSYIAGKPLKDLTLGDSEYLMAASRMYADKEQEVCDVLNGKTNYIPGKINKNYLIKAGSKNPLKPVQKKAISLDELSSQTSGKQEAHPERQALQTQRQPARNQLISEQPVIRK